MATRQPTCCFYLSACLPACLPSYLTSFSLYPFDLSEFPTMVKDTGVPKLRGTSNSQQWYTRLKTYMIAKETWPAVRCVPQKKADKETGSEKKFKDSEFSFDDEDNDDDEFKYHPK